MCTIPHTTNLIPQLEALEFRIANARSLATRMHRAKEAYAPRDGEQDERYRFIQYRMLVEIVGVEAADRDVESIGSSIVGLVDPSKDAGATRKLRP